MALLTAAGNADNDVCDRVADKVNHPNRPLPSGRLGVTQVQVWAAMLYLAGFVLAVFASPAHAWLTGSMVFLLLAYNRVLKSLPLWGNATVALLCALAIYFTEFPHVPYLTLPAIFFAFVSTFARELIKDLEDVQGDRLAGLRTFPIVVGEEKARQFSWVLVGTLLLALPMPFFIWGYGWPYAALALVLVTPWLIALLMELSQAAPNYRRCQFRCKMVMATGMVALAAGMMPGG